MLGANDDHQLVARDRLADREPDRRPRLRQSPNPLRPRAPQPPPGSCCRSTAGSRRRDRRDGRRRDAAAANSRRSFGSRGRTGRRASSSPNSERTSSADLARAKTARASARNSAPASVNSMRRPTRLKSFAPCRPSSARDRGADRRLCDVERLGGARDMLAFRDGDEDTELFERHRLDVIRLRRRRLYEGRLELEPRRSAFSLLSARRSRRRLRLVRQVCQIVDNRRDVLRVDWRLVRIPHLLDLGLPDGAG